MELAHKQIVVVGLGTTGEAVTAFLTKRGARVTVTDAAGPDELGQRAERVKAMGAVLELGSHRQESFDRADWIVISPGVPHTIEPVRRAIAKGVRLIGEIELAFRFIEEPILAVTGTNGKTTTTEMIGQMLMASGLATFVGGNIGTPLIGYADQPQKAAVVVAEISSFQLDTIETFRPRIGVLLNVAEDHLDRYAGLEEYARSKARLFENQQVEDLAILNAADPISRRIGDTIRSSKRLFAYTPTDRPPDDRLAARITDERLIFQIKVDRSRGQHGLLSLNRSDYPLHGQHNWENAAAAGLAVLAAGGSAAGIKATLREFKGLAHRLERIRTCEGITYYNDSKATNVAAVQRALAGFRHPVVLIMGGRNKDCDFNLLKDAVKQHVKQVVAIGEARPEINRILAGSAPVQLADSMPDAVKKASRAAVEGDVVLLSPACTSFDMYNSYAERGDDFRAAVQALGPAEAEARPAEPGKHD